MLCRLRMAKGLAQKEVAAALHITQQGYSKIERSDIVKEAVVKAVLSAMHSDRDELAISNFLNVEHRINKRKI